MHQTDLKGRLIGNKVSWGQVDKLLPPPSGKPFTLPDLTALLRFLSYRRFQSLRSSRSRIPSNSSAVL